MSRIYDRPLDGAALTGLEPGRLMGDLKPWAWWSFADEGLREKTIKRKRKNWGDFVVIEKIRFGSHHPVFSRGVGDSINDKWRVEPLAQAGFGHS